MTILERIVAYTHLRVEQEKEERPLGKLLPYAGRAPFAFEQALGAEGVSFICEVKKASPSKGLIAANFPYRDIARSYEAAGAAAISVLTEPSFFLGSNRHLEEIRREVSLPLLRKDFTVDEYQIYQAAALGADAVLLLGAVLAGRTIASFIKIADSLGLSTLVEAHNQEEIQTALEAGARVIGVNNRNLGDLTVDTANSTRLRRFVPDSVLFVAESGLQCRQDIVAMERHGVNAVLIGEALMRSPDKKAMLDVLRGKAV